LTREGEAPRRSILTATACLAVVAAFVAPCCCHDLDHSANVPRARRCSQRRAVGGSGNAHPTPTPTANARTRLQRHRPGRPPRRPPGPAERSGIFVAQGTEPSIAAIVSLRCRRRRLGEHGHDGSTERLQSAGRSHLTGRRSTWAAPVYPCEANARTSTGPRLGPQLASVCRRRGGRHGRLVMSVSHSDDLGKTWSVPFVEPFTRAGPLLPGHDGRRLAQQPQLRGGLCGLQLAARQLRSRRRVMASRDGETGPRPS